MFVKHLLNRNLLPLLLAFCAPFVANAADYYWIGGAGNWSDVNHWATTSGGTTLHAVIPNVNDDVYFDAGSGFTAASKTVTLNGTPNYCRNMTWNGATNTPRLLAMSGKDLYIYGSLTLQPNMLYDVNSTYFRSNNPSGETISTFGNVIGLSTLTIEGNFVFSGNSTWTLQDDLTLGSLTTARGGITLSSGTLITNGKKLNIAYFVSSGTNASVLNIENSEITLRRGSGSARPWTYTSPHTLLATGSKLIFTGQFLSSVQFTSSLIASSGDVYDEVEFTNPTSNYATIENDVFVRKITFIGGGFLNGNVETDSLIMSSNNIYNFGAGKTQKINKYFYAVNSYCDGYVELRSSTTATLNFDPTAEIHVESATIANLTTTSPVIALNSVDFGGNSNFTFPAIAGKDLYWVGGSGNWNDKEHWSLLNDGVYPGNGCVPTPSDNVFFNSNSGFSAGNNQVTSDATNAYCKNMTWNDASNTPELIVSQSGLNVFGSLTLQKDMQFNVYATRFRSGNLGETIQTNGTIFGKPGSADYCGNITFNGNGSWTFLDSIVTGGANAFSTAGRIVFTKGNLNTNGQYIHVWAFVSTGSEIRSLNIENSEIVIRANYSGTTGYPTGTTHGWNYSGSNKSLLANNSNIKIIGINNSTSSSYFVGNGNDQYNHVSFTHPSSADMDFKGPVHVKKLSFAGNGRITTGTNRIDSLYLSSGKSYKFIGSASGSTVINKLLMAHSVSCDGLISLTTNNAGVPARISIVAGATVDINAANISYINAITTSIIANNSLDGDNNTNVAFPATPSATTMYWVGGSGSWADQNHWSTISDDTYPPHPSSQGCVPTLIDNVVFNDNSWASGTGTNVILDVNTDFYCHDMSWIGSTAFSPTISGDITKKLGISGSLILQQGMHYQVNRTNMLSNNLNDSIVSNSTIIGEGLNEGDISFSGNGSWKLVDNFTVNRYILFSKGTLNTNNQTVTAQRFSSNGSGVRNLILGSSTLNLTANTSSWGYTGANRTLNAGNSVIRFPSPSLSNISNSIIFKGDNNDQYNDVIFVSPSATYGGFQGPVKVKKLYFYGNGDLFEDNQIDTLVFSPGKSYKLEANKLQTINNVFYSSGNPCKITTVRSTSSSIQAKVNVQAGTTNFNFATISGIDATPSYQNLHFGAQSVDNGNNSDILFDPYDPEAVIEGLGSDVTLIDNCDNISYMLNTSSFFTNPETTFLWSDGSTDPQLNVTSTGTYSLLVNYGDGCTISSSINISCFMPLPIKLISFSGTCNDAITLNWVTATESNVSHFEILRSKDGFVWDLVTTVTAAGNSSTKNFYSAEDKRGNETYYYVLKSVDFDGEVSTSNPISVVCNTEKPEWSIYPVPAQTNTTLSISSTDDLSEILSVYDINGREIYQQAIEIKTGKNIIDLDVSTYAGGTYFVRLTDNSKFPALKLVKY